MRAYAYVWVLILASLDWLAKYEALSLYGGQKTLISGWLRLNVIRHHRLIVPWLSAEAPLWTYTVLAALVLVALALWAWRTPRRFWLRHLGLIAMMAGALGNGGERWWRGFVTDFIDLRPLPVFNLADCFIVFGMVVLVASLWVSPPSQ